MKYRFAEQKGLETRFHIAPENATLRVERSIRGNSLGIARNSARLLQPFVEVALLAGDQRHLRRRHIDAV
nr:hypothetical protein [Mesorhizobium sp.]